MTAAAQPSGSRRVAGPSSSVPPASPAQAPAEQPLFSPSQPTERPASYRSWPPSKRTSTLRPPRMESDPTQASGGHLAPQVGRMERVLDEDWEPYPAHLGGPHRHPGLLEAEARNSSSSEGPESDEISDDLSEEDEDDDDEEDDEGEEEGADEEEPYDYLRMTGRSNGSYGQSSSSWQHGLSSGSQQPAASNLPSDRAQLEQMRQAVEFRDAKRSRTTSPWADASSTWPDDDQEHGTFDYARMKQQLQGSYDVSSLPPRPDPLEPPSLTPPDVTLRHFEVIGTVGKGTFGQVLLVRFKGLAATDPRSYFALKAMNKRDIVRMRQVEHVNSEKDIMKKIKHPFIISCHLTFQDSKCVYLLMDFAKGGEIFSHLRRVRRFPVDVTRFYIANVVLMLEHLHSNDIVYRDLKPENLLLDDLGYLKLADFGFAKQLNGRTYTLCGTPPFLAPEVICGSGHGKAADWWALGILMYELLCGYPPWHSDNALGTYDLILQGQLVFPPHVDFLAQDLIRSLLSSDLTRRLGNLAGGSTDVKRHGFFAKVDWTQLVNKSIPAPIVPLAMPPTETSLLSNFDAYDEPDPDSFPALLGREQEGEWKGECEFDRHFRTF